MKKRIAWTLAILIHIVSLPIGWTISDDIIIWIKDNFK